jgi:hypothetical protein
LEAHLVTTQPRFFLATRALTGGFQRALLACAFVLLTAALIGLRATNTHGEPTASPDDIHAGHDRIPARELTD